MKRRSGLQEEDDDGDSGKDINIKRWTSPQLPSTGQERAITAITTMTNAYEETRTTTEMKATTKSNVDIVDVHDYYKNEKGAATETTQKIKQDNIICGISFREYENEEISSNDENSIASHDASFSDRPGAFAVQGPRFNNNNTTDDGTVQYSTGAFETSTQSQEEQEIQTTAINNPLEAEQVMETVQGTSVTLNQNESQTKWKQLTAILGIFLFMLCVIAAVLITFFVRSNQNGNESLPSSSTPPPVATATSPSPTNLPTFAPSMIPSAAPTSVQQQIITILFDYFPDMPASNDQEQALDWIFTDSTSLGIIMDEGLTSNNKRRMILERFVLATIYFATNGIGWRNNNAWLSSLFVCQWYGIECQLDATLEQREVNFLDFNNNNLIGSIPTAVGLMTSMTWLYLYINALTGSIPTEIGLMTNMVDLQLSNNALTGSIPTEVGLMTGMTTLNLADNALTGSIPTEVGSMTNMIYLSLHINTLTSSIPTEVGLMTSMILLNLSHNALSGSLPTEVGLMTNILYVQLYDNILTGPIPTEVGLLTRLTQLSLSGNSNLTGTIPSEVVSILLNLRTCFMGNTSLIDIPEKCRGIMQF